MKRILLIFTILCLASITQAQETPKKILFIGNSYTYTNDLPSLIQQMAENIGCRIEYEQVTPGGASFSRHYSTTGAMDKIREGGWDIVVLQAQSQEPSFPWSQFSISTYPYACQLSDAIYQYSECPEVMFYMTWGHKNGDSINASEFDSLATYEGMDNLLYERYMFMAQQNKASVSPVGRVWRKLRTEHPELELYQNDESHPSVIGSYAAACTFTTLIFRQDPTTISTNLSIDSTAARIIRENAKIVVYDSLYLYSCHTFASAEPTSDSLHWLFHCRSSSTPESIIWDFGDGSTSTETNPSHTYTPGTYTVRLIAGKRCAPDTSTIVLAINNSENPEEPNSIDTNFEINNLNIKIYPNPATSHFTVESSEPLTLKLIDCKGLSIIQKEVSGSLTVNIENISSGLYLISIDNHVVGKMIKK